MSRQRYPEEFRSKRLTQKTFDISIRCLLLNQDPPELKTEIAPVSRCD